MKTPLRQKADKAKIGRCKNLIAVLEEPSDVKNIGTVIRNVNALGVEKVYIVDSQGVIPKNWDSMRDKRDLLKPSVGSVRWTFVKKFKTTDECMDHLEKNKFVSVVTSPHIKGKMNVILQDGDFTQKRLAVWFGTESRGISDRAVERSCACVAIEQYGIVESLNLATSTGIVLYEITKQRRAYNKINKRGRRTDPPIKK
ncbi:MAG TPA: RNA methyltransferase [Alphaproteobacteria bacterium]|nr:RNA methyltransferase [Alphaproteobacteria bacterium]